MYRITATTAMKLDLKTTLLQGKHIYYQVDQILLSIQVCCCQFFYVELCETHFIFADNHLSAYHTVVNSTDPETLWKHPWKKRKC